MTDDFDAYSQGYDAAVAGDSIANCPYDFGTDEYGHWMDGWIDGGER